MSKQPIDLKAIFNSEDFQPAPCPYFGKCGGCTYQNIKYDAQLRHKEKQVRELFGECSPIIPSPEIFHYRNRMDFSFGPNFTVGLKNGWASVINLDQCLLVTEKFNQVLNKIRDFAKGNDLASYLTELPGQERGIMRHVVIREGINIPNIVLNVITSDQDKFPLEKLWDEFKNNISGATWSINLSPADRSIGDIQATFGKDHLLESLGGLRFKIPVQSFFQTNPKQAETLLRTAEKFAELKGGETVIDLYSGTGSFGLLLASKAKEVIGIEENEPATKLSIENAALNGIKNYSALAGRVEDIFPQFNKKCDVVIVDPPRPGIHKRAIKALGDLRPAKIVYVSCNPTTQKTDVDKLKEFGYKITACQPLDMFPHTPHVENVIKLEF
ncbi:MAG: 23S rRNA (uracil(1939)-C(5))-methyltransferase RlmD [Candidatus Margulisiibacteriota bacterium]